MPWVNPRWGSLTGPDAEALRAIFESISEWTRNPSFGNATNPTIAGGGMVQVQPQALTIKNEWIQSANFASGSAGWQIKANGDAEFNEVDIRGNLELTSGTHMISLKSQHGDLPGTIQPGVFFDGGFRPGMFITSPSQSGQDPGPDMTFQGRSSAGGDRKWSVHFADVYTVGNRFEVNELSSIVRVFGNFNSTGAISATGNISTGATFIGGHFETSSGNHWTGTGRIFVRAGYVVAGSVGEGIITTGSTAGIRIGQRNRGSNDITESYAIYGNNDQLGIYNQTIGDVMTFRNVGGWHEWKSLGLPALGGTTLVITGTGQIGPTTSSSEAKRNIVLLPETENANPLWKIKPRRAQWDPTKVGNAAEENERLPNGFATTLVEDWVEQGALDAIHVNAEGVPYALDHGVIQSYIISAVQHCHEGLARRVAKEEELERRVAAIEAHPVLKGKK